jgi:hypothetical protein
MDESNGPRLPVKVAKQDGLRDVAPVLDTPAPSQLLCELTTELVYFTPALLLTHGFFDRDPVAEFLRFHPLDADAAPFSIDCRWPFFQGLGVGVIPNTAQQVAWDHRLYACRHQHWPACREFIARLSGYSLQHKYYARICYHDVVAGDPTAANSGRVFATYPTIPVTCFSVSTNRNQIYLAETHELRRRPRVSYLPANAAVRAEAERLFATPGDPSQLLRGPYGQLHQDVSGNPAIQGDSDG